MNGILGLPWLFEKVMKMWQFADLDVAWKGQYGPPTRLLGGFNLESSKLLKSLPSFMVRIDGMVEIQARGEMGENDGIGQSTGVWPFIT
jgi:hypothetical protein